MNLWTSFFRREEEGAYEVNIVYRKQQPRNRDKLVQRIMDAAMQIRNSTGMDGTSC